MEFEKKILGFGKMAQLVKVPITKPDDLTSIPKTQMVAMKRCICAVTYTCVSCASLNVHTHINLYNKCIVLVRVIITVIKHYDENNLDRKMVMWVRLSYCCSLLMKIRTGIDTGQEPGGRN